jgi:predicted DNA-binding transcriptional regulator YafY
MSRLERLYKIDAAIRSGRYPGVLVLSQEHEVKERTIKADIRYLKQRVHAPLRHDRGRGGYHYTDTSFVLPRLILTDGEIAAVQRALRAAQEFGGVAGDVEALELLASRVAGVTTLQQSGPTVAGGSRLTASALVSAELLAEIERARQRRCRVMLRYHGAHRGEETERTIQPWHLFLVDGEWYVTGFCEDRKAQRDFHLSRIQEAKVLTEEGAYRVPQGFDGAAYVRSALGVRHGEPPVTVTVRFSPYQSKWIAERTYHPTQTLTPQPDGSTLLTMTVTGTWEVRRWVLGFGAEAEVLEPQSLRDELQDELKKLRKIYAGSAEGALGALSPRSMESK